MICRQGNECVFSGATPSIQAVLRKNLKGTSRVWLMQKICYSFWLLPPKGRFSCSGRVFVNFRRMC